jgi:hypothetical protein
VVREPATPTGAHTDAGRCPDADLWGMVYRGMFPITSHMQRKRITPSRDHFTALDAILVQHYPFDSITICLERTDEPKRPFNSVLYVTLAHGKTATSGVPANFHELSGTNKERRPEKLCEMKRSRSNTLAEVRSKILFLA